MAKPKISLRETFLRMFIAQLIKDSTPKIKEADIKEVSARKIETERLQQRNPEIQKQVKLPTIRNNPEIMKNSSLLSSPQMPIPKIHSFPVKDRNAPSSIQSYKPSLPLQGFQQEPINLGRLTKILLDPSVQSIECPGPGKNVLVNRYGVIQTSPLALTSPEINSMLHEVSDKTRIPLIQGLFKAAFHDLVLTAVVSEHVDTRFMIQKINPFQQEY